MFESNQPHIQGHAHRQYSTRLLGTENFQKLTENMLFTESRRGIGRHAPRISLSQTIKVLFFPQTNSCWPIRLLVHVQAELQYQGISLEFTGVDEAKYNQLRTCNVDSTLVRLGGGSGAPDILQWPVKRNVSSPLPPKEATVEENGKSLWNAESVYGH